MKQQEILWRRDRLKHKKKRHEREKTQKHTQSRVCLGTCSSTGVQGCPHVSVCLLLACPSHFYDVTPTVTTCLYYPLFCSSVFMFACLSICRSVPLKRFTYQRSFSFSTWKRKSHYIPLSISIAGDKLKSGT